MRRQRLTGREMILYPLGIGLIVAGAVVGDAFNRFVGTPLLIFGSVVLSATLQHRLWGRHAPLSEQESRSIQMSAEASTASSEGVITSSAMRFGLIIGVVATALAIGFLSLTIVASVGAIYVLLAGVFVVLAPLPLIEGLTARITYSAVGLTASTFPWRRRRTLTWNEITRFSRRQDGKVGAWTKVGRWIPLLGFARTRRQVLEAERAIRILEIVQARNLERENHLG